MAPRSARGAAESACSWAWRRSLTAPNKQGFCSSVALWCSWSGPHSSDARAAELIHVDPRPRAAGPQLASGDLGVKGRPASAIQPVAHETRDRIITGLVTVVPILLLGLAAWQAWSEALRWSDLVVL